MAGEAQRGEGTCSRSHRNWALPPSIQDTGPHRAVAHPSSLWLGSDPLPPTTTWAWLYPRTWALQGVSEQDSRWTAAAATALPCASWPAICPHRAMRLWCLESYSWGPSQSPGYCPLATARPGRTHCQRWAEQAEGRRSGYPDSRTDEGQVSERGHPACSLVAERAGAPPDLSPIQQTREP